MKIDDGNEFKLIAKTIDEDEVFLGHNSIMVRFANKRNGIVSSWLNGGYSEDLSGVFNHQLSQSEIDDYADGGILGFLEDLSKLYSNELDLKSNKLSGLVTSADVNHYSIAIERFREIEVMAIATAGVRVNAVSAGDDASYYEINGNYEFDTNDSISPGTINIILLINSRLDESSLLLAEMILAEAKSAALRELMASSNYSDEIATGTGTDGFAIFSNLDSENFIENMSTHAKIGELIAKAVKASIKEALANLQWLTPSYQSDALIRLDRFKMNLDEFYSDVLNIDNEEDKKEFISSLVKVSKNPELVGYVSLIIHLIDQYRMGLLSKKAAIVISNSILESHFNRKDWQSMKLLLEYVLDEKLAN